MEQQLGRCGRRDSVWLFLRVVQMIVLQRKHRRHTCRRTRALVIQLLRVRRSASDGGFYAAADQILGHVPLLRELALTFLQLRSGACAAVTAFIDKLLGLLVLFLRLKERLASIGAILVIVVGRGGGARFFNRATFK